MIRLMLSVAAMACAAPSFADESLPAAIVCYQTATNSQDIDAYMDCFTEDAMMIDVRREFEGHDAIRTWAEREVMPRGASFQHRAILEGEDGHARTEMN